MITRIRFTHYPLTSKDTDRWSILRWIVWRTEILISRMEKTLGSKFKVTLSFINISPHIKFIILISAFHFEWKIWYKSKRVIFYHLRCSHPRIVKTFGPTSAEGQFSLFNKPLTLTFPSNTLNLWLINSK